MDAIEARDLDAVRRVDERDPWRQRELCEAAARADFFDALLVFHRKGFQWDHRTSVAASDECVKRWLARRGCPPRRRTADILDALRLVVDERFENDPTTRAFFLGQLDELLDVHERLKAGWDARATREHLGVVAVAVVLLFYVHFCLK